MLCFSSRLKTLLNVYAGLLLTLCATASLAVDLQFPCISLSAFLSYLYCTELLNTKRSRKGVIPKLI